jgi:hypothetical protein
MKCARNAECLTCRMYGEFTELQTGAWIADKAARLMLATRRRLQTQLEAPFFSTATAALDRTGKEKPRGFFSPGPTTFIDTTPGKVCYIIHTDNVLVISGSGRRRLHRGLLHLETTERPTKQSFEVLF